MLRKLPRFSQFKIRQLTTSNKHCRFKTPIVLLQSNYISERFQSMTFKKQRRLRPVKQIHHH